MLKKFPLMVRERFKSVKAISDAHELTFHHSMTICGMEQHFSKRMLTKTKAYPIAGIGQFRTGIKFTGCFGCSVLLFSNLWNDLEDETYKRMFRIDKISDQDCSN
jgi:hypothetical protein